MFCRRRGLFGGSLGFIAFAHWPDVGGGIGDDQLDELTGCSFVWAKKEGSLHNVEWRCVIMTTVWDDVKDTYMAHFMDRSPQ
jgi:hypothetical protein